MRTTRSYKFFTDSHGLCSFQGECKYKTCVGNGVYCGDKNGEWSDFCPWYIMTAGKLCYIEWIRKYKDWSTIKAVFRERRGASFMLPVVTVPVEGASYVYALGNPNDYHEHTVGIRAVMYTTDYKIAEIYGTRMEYFSYTFLRTEFERELTEFNNARMSRR